MPPLACGVGLGAPWRAARGPSGPPAPPFDGTLIFSGLPDVDQTIALGRLASWADSQGRPTSLVPVTGATAGPSAVIAGKTGLRIASIAADCMKLSGAAAGSWPAIAASPAAAGPQGVTAYYLIQFVAIGVTAPLSMGAVGQPNFVHCLAGSPTPNKAAIRQLGIGSAGGITTANIPTGTPVVLGCRWGDPAAGLGVAARPMAVKLGLAVWAETDFNRAAQTSSVLRATVGAYGIETATPILPINATVLSVLFYAGAHTDAQAEAVRAFLEGL